LHYTNISSHVMGLLSKCWSSRFWSWIIYGLLLVLRFVACALPGYIHPDEFFQSGQELWFGCPQFIPWEFESQNALRSVFPPWIMTWLPLQIYAGLMNMMNYNNNITTTTTGTLTNTAPFANHLSGQEVLIIPRIMCVVLSIIMVDTSVWVLSKQKKNTSSTITTETQRNQDIPVALLIFASAWPCWAMLNRPFTNSLETMILAVLMVVACCCRPDRINSVQQQSKNNNINSLVYGTMIGILCALGFFTRFTFVCYAFPVVLLYMWRTTKSKGQEENGLFFWMIQRVMYVIVPMVIGFVLIAMGLIYVDNIYYGTMSTAISEEQQQPPQQEHWATLLQITPLNAFLYNSKTDNLRDHGLHPRWTHALVNMHILYGPLTILCYWVILFQRQLKKAHDSRLLLLQGSSSNGELYNDNNSIFVPTMCRWIILCGLGLLSSAPHQEPRFLLPLLVPLVILCEDTIQTYRILQVGWVGFNVILFLLFGIVHQGGVVPSLLSTQTRAQQVYGVSQPSSSLPPPPDAVLYYHTYMPPTFLSRQRRYMDDTTCKESSGNTCLSGEDERSILSTCPAYPIIDLKGDSNPQSLRNSLDYYLSCSSGDSSSFDRRVHLVSPPLTLSVSKTSGGEKSGDKEAAKLSSDCFVGTNFECRQLVSYYAHLTTEDLPPFRYSLLDMVKDFNLSVYEISCRNS